MLEKCKLDSRLFQASSSEMFKSSIALINNWINQETRIHPQI